ncbi:MAG: cytochrome c oxidase subunit II [Acidimicrobiales bacterium]
MHPLTTRSWRSAPGSDQPLTAPADRPCRPEPTGRGRRSRWMVGLAVAAPLLLGGCSFFPSYGTSRGATTQGQDTFKLYSGMMTTGIIVGGLVFLLILFTVFRFRRRSDEMPRQFHENIPIEILYTVIPVLIVAGLFVFTVLTENNVDATVPVNATVTSTGRPVVDIRVTAFQWGWRFDYPSLNVGVAGETTNGPDDHGPQMVVPVGQTVQITLVSNDVIHGFYVRDFDFQRMALPGVTNVFDLDVVRQGTFPGQCSEICGLYHSEMLFSVRSVSPSQFRLWAKAQVAAGHTLQLGGSSAANTPPLETHITPSNALAPPSTAKGSV